MSKAFIFTMDAVLALIPVFVLMGTVSILSGSDMVHMQAQTMDRSHRADDALAVMEKQGNMDDFGRMFANYSKLKVDGDSRWQNERNNLLALVNTTLGPMIPEHLGYGVDFWGQYANGTEYIDLEFTTDNRTLAGAERPYENESNSIEAASKMVSGYEKERPIKGCVARAELEEMSKTTTEVITFGPQGSGWGTTNTVIGKTFELPSDANITNATFYVSIHYRDLSSFTVNGVDIRSRLAGAYTCNGIDWRYSCNWGSYPYYAFGAADVTDLITAGTNTVAMTMSHSNFHAHIHPGMKIVITYETSQSESSSMTKRFYFDRVLGGTGAWQVLDFYVPTGGTVSSATLYLHAEGIDDRYLIELNGNTVAECYSSCLSTYDNTSSITSYLQSGTNVVMAYFDASGNNEYGSTATEISNSSYVEIQYASLPTTTFGYIDLARVLQFGGAPGNPKEINFSIPGGHDTILEAFTHTAQQRSLLLRVEAWAQGDSPTRVFDSPDDRAVPAAVFINPAIFESNSTNYVELEDIGNSAYYVLPESDVEYTFLVPSQVSFGSVFDICDGHQYRVYYDTNEDGLQDGSTLVRSSQPAGFDKDTYGEDDALQRLLDELNFYVNESINSGDSGTSTNPIDVELIDINFEGQGVGDVPYMWGPLRIRIRIWG